MPIKKVREIAKAQAESKENICKDLLLFVEKEINSKLEKEAPTDFEDENNPGAYYSFDVNMFSHKDYLLFFEDGLKEMIVAALTEAGYSNVSLESTASMAIKVRFELTGDQMDELTEAKEKALTAYRSLQKKREAQ